MDRAVEGAAQLRIIFIETPANPTLRMTDIQRAVDAARQLRGRRW